MRFLEVYAGPNRIALWGDPYTGGIRVEVNELRELLDRHTAQELAENLGRFLETTEPCPRCAHPRVEHFRLFTHGGYLNGCSHGTGEGYQLARGLPCDCPGTLK